MTKPALLELPQGVQLAYLAEGGANVIFRFVAKPAKPSLAVKDPGWPLSTVTVDGIEHVSLPPQLRGKLLRLRKETAANTPYSEIVHNFNSDIRPLFSQEELVDQTLIRLPEGLLRHYNDELRLLEINGQRPKKRHGGYLCLEEPFGLLITDMTAFDDPDAILAEFKPKWLTQSPSAPKSALRCRTCALREMKNNDARNMGTKQQHSFCPMDLVSESFKDVFHATAFVPGCNDRERLARILYKNLTLRKLRSQQILSEKVGLYGPSERSQTKSLGMTLRDCTMFVKIPRDENAPPEIRLGDLDFKSSTGGKAEYWKAIELELINRGWYDASNDSQSPSGCSLQFSSTIDQPQAKP